MNRRIQTGIKGLDTILDGGFLRHNSILLKGAPGTGKTSLGIQTLLQGIEEGEKGIICSFEQFPQQLYRDTRSFGWDLEGLVEAGELAVLFLRPEDMVVQSGQPHAPVLSHIMEKADELDAKRLLLDSVTHFNRITSDPVECRSLLLQFINDIKSTGITPLLTAELHSADSNDFSFEEYLVDEVVKIHNDLAVLDASLPSRSIEVTKTRGHGHIRGCHPFSFTSEGIAVYPHILPEPFEDDEKEEEGMDPVSTGIKDLNGLLSGGYPRGSSTIVAGMSGAYKTTLAASFLQAGMAEGERCLFLTFEERPSRLRKMLRDRGIVLDNSAHPGEIAFRHYVPKKCCLDQIFAELETEILENRVQRVVIDSLDDFERSVDKPSARKDYLAMFLAALNRGGVTALFTEKLQQISHNPIADIRYVSMVDTVIYLGNVEIESRIHKVISVLKSRGARAESDLREIECNSQGLRVTHKFTGLTGILQGSAQGQFKATVENIFQPLYFIRDFAKMGSGESVSDGQRRQIVNNILNQLGGLEDALKDHFGFDPEVEKKK